MTTHLTLEHKKGHRTQTFKMIAIDSLRRGQYQPRVAFEKNTLHDLAQSILTQGLIEPLVVREITTHQYEIIAGERRWRAAKLAGLTELPCLIGCYSDEQAATIALIENIQREDLNLLEEADGYQRLLHEFHFKQDEVAHLVGKSRSHVANILRLLTLCNSVQMQLRQKVLSLGHARMLVGLSPLLQETLAHETTTNDWSVRRLEEEVRACKQKPIPALPHTQDLDRARLQSQIAEQIGAPVQITSENEPGGWLKIKFFDNETLSGLLDRMGLRYD